MWISQGCPFNLPIHVVLYNPGLKISGIKVKSKSDYFHKLSSSWALKTKIL